MGNIDVDLVSAFFFPLHYLTGKQNIKHEITRRNIIRNRSSRFPLGNNDLKVRERSKKKEVRDFRICPSSGIHCHTQDSRKPKLVERWRSHQVLASLLPSMGETGNFSRANNWVREAGNTASQGTQPFIPFIPGKITKTIGFFKFQNFRDCHNPVLIGISSYALKSVVMNMILERPSKVWNRANIQEHFLEVLRNK